MALTLLPGLAKRTVFRARVFRSTKVLVHAIKHCCAHACLPHRASTGVPRTSFELPSAAARRPCSTCIEIARCSREICAWYVGTEPNAFGFVGLQYQLTSLSLQLWISRINVAAAEHSVSYNTFVHQLAQAGIVLNRKILSELAIHEPQSFKALAELTKARSTEAKKGLLNAL